MHDVNVNNYIYSQQHFDAILLLLILNSLDAKKRMSIINMFYLSQS